MGITAFYPRVLKERIRKLIVFSDMKVSPERYITLILYSALFLTVIVGLLTFSLSIFNFLLVFVLSFIILNIFLFAFLTIKADSRAKLAEEVLPDALELTASNLRAGLTPERALLLAARPEFGPLQQEIDRAGKDIALGKDINIALMRISKRLMSENIEKVLSLIASGVKSGGNLAELLEQASISLKKNEMIAKRKASVSAVYVMFIFTAISFGAPFLFATSTFLVEMMGNIMADLELPEAGALPVLLTAPPVSADTIIPLVIIMLAVTCIMASFLIGEISKGKARYGFRYMPALAALSIAMFFIFRFLIGKLIGGAF